MPNPFRKKAENVGLSEKEKNWGKVKFNPISKAIDRAEAATPWHVFKHGIIEKQNEDLHEAKAMNMNTAEAQKFLKEREYKHRKSIMEQKRKEPTKWEDFGASDNPHATGKPQERKNKYGDKKEFTKELTQLVKTNKKADGTFDNKLLNFNQNNLVRGIITKNVNLSKSQTNLSHVVKHLKYQKMKNEIKNKYKK